MSNTNSDIVFYDENGTPIVLDQTASGLVGLALLGLAAVGGYVVAKKTVAHVRENMKIRREMKKLYKQHKKVKSTDK